MIAARNIIQLKCFKTVDAFLSLKFSSVLLGSRPTSLLPKYGYRFYCDKEKNDTNSTNKAPHDNDSSIQHSQMGFESKYKVFQDSDAPILLDVYEEKSQLEQISISGDDEDDRFHGVNLERGKQGVFDLEDLMELLIGGKHGVFDLEDLIELLRRDKAEDIFVAELPPEGNYVDYIVIVNGRSRRHMTALAEIVRRVFKKKRLSSDILPRLEGETSSDWMALDLGNIALHIFSRDTRNVYDLESLWSVGPEFDPLSNTPEDALSALMKKHSISFQDFHSKGQLL